MEKGLKETILIRLTEAIDNDTRQSDLRIEEVVIWLLDIFINEYFKGTVEIKLNSNYVESLRKIEEIIEVRI